MRVELSAEAEGRHVQGIDTSWRENRPGAPDLFTNELEAALLTLELAPAPGARYEPKPPVRRVLLRRTHHHLYFIEDGVRVLVLAVWSAFRGQGPQL